MPLPSTLLERLREHRARRQRRHEHHSGGSGRGGPLGTPSLDLDMASPSQDQESNAVVSGGGLVGSSDRSAPSEKARRQA